MNAFPSWQRTCRKALRDLRRNLENPGSVDGEVAQEMPDPPSALTWLRAAPASAARALFGPDRVGLGQAWRKDGRDLRVLDQDGPFSQRWISLPFDMAQLPSRPWSSFGQVRCWTPQLEWRRGKGLVARWRRESGGWQATLRLLEALQQGIEQEHPPCPVRLPDQRPALLVSRAAWRSQVALALEAMGHTVPPMDKVVLARSMRQPLTEACTALDLLEDLWRAEPESWPYFLAWPGGPQLLGATPEELFTRRGSRLRTMALAGTRPRGVGRMEDRALGRALLDGAKEQHEQGVVVHWLKETLAPLCEGELRVGARRLRRLGRVQHLQSQVEGRLRKGQGDVHVLEALHPTPALCGAPRPAALEWIRRNEGQARGLYGGVLGILEPNGSQCRVAIRGALASKGHVRLWAGAGLVPGSVADDEWQETSLKLDTLFKAWRRT